MKFNAVGIIGAAVQLGLLTLLLKAGWNYLFATALAVEAAVLHNYFWHVRWTWKDRQANSQVSPLIRFHLANGLVSVISNLVLMRALAGWMAIPPVPANLIAIIATSLLNFAVGNRWVFPAS